MRLLLAAFVLLFTTSAAMPAEAPLRLTSVTYSFGSAILTLTRGAQTMAFVSMPSVKAEVQIGIDWQEIPSYNAVLLRPQAQYLFRLTTIDGRVYEVEIPLPVVR